MEKWRRWKNGEDGKMVNMEKIGRWKKEKMEKWKKWENEEYGKMENMGKLRLWENGGYGKMENMGKWRIWENGRDSKIGKGENKKKKWKKAKIERWEMIRWKTLDI